MRINVEKRNVKDWLGATKSAAKGQHYPKLWGRVHELVEVPSRRRASVNLSKLNAKTKEGDNVVVPGKVLSSGRLDHKINIAAIEFSAGAEKALKASGSRIVQLDEMMKTKKVSVII
ncbi:MAG: 50S ribosomal protein L18e [Candidatus Micrarchaeota archaeon]|nr:50S ribosomal protein L18e [Candidatus Micrarchaeota archaeon]